MADVKTLKQLNIGGENYLLKDAEARTRLTTAEADIDALEAGKQNVIDASNKLAASLVSFTKDGDSQLASTDVNAALLELENAIETGGTGSVVTVEKAETTAAEYAATYVVKQGGAQVGVAINIPKDYLVKSAELKTAGASDPSGFPEGTKYIDFVVNAKDGAGTESHIYLNVADLVDAYTADESTIQMVNNQFSVKAVPMNLVTGLADALDAKAAKADLQEEIDRAKAAEALKEDKSNLKALAYKDSATGTVSSQTITGVKATGNLAGSASITLTSTPTTYTIPDTQKIDYTPAGTIAAKATDGSFSALKTATFGADNNGVQISGTNAASEVTIEKVNATVLGSVKTAAVAPSFTDGKIGTFVAPTLTIAESDSFAKEAFVASVDDASETLILTAASTGKASVCSGWDAGSWTAGTFNAGSAAEFNNVTVVGSITSAEAAAQVFTGNKYSVATTADTALKEVEFTGTTSAKLVPTAITYDKANAEQSGSVNITGAELAVGAITVAANDVTVS